jgi:hypothetical protein
MNFITYINQQGVFKTVECTAVGADGLLKTVSAINENFLVTAVFVNSVKRKVVEGSGVSPVQCAVINDDNFDGNLLDQNHYNVEGTKFEAFLIDLPVVGGGSTVPSVSSASAGGSHYPKLIKFTLEDMDHVVFKRHFDGGLVLIFNKASGDNHIVSTVSHVGAGTPFVFLYALQQENISNNELFVFGDYYFQMTGDFSVYPFRFLFYMNELNNTFGLLCNTPNLSYSFFPLDVSGTYLFKFNYYGARFSMYVGYKAIPKIPVTPA